MSKLRIAAAVAATLVLAAVPAAGEPAKGGDAASPWVELYASRARLVAGQASAASGARLAGLQIAMADGWKTYWRMPGDAGVPPTFDWSGSANVGSIKVLYPAPKRMPEADGEVIGYKGTVLFPIEVTPQDEARPVALKLALELGICREICIPAVAKFDLSLPPSGTAAQPDTTLAAAVERVPRPQAQRRPKDPELKQIAVGNADTGSRLTIAGVFHGKGADVFVEAPDGLYVPLPRKEAQDANGLVRFAVDLSRDLARDLKGKTLTVTLVSDAGATEARWTVP